MRLGGVRLAEGLSAMAMRTNRLSDASVGNEGGVKKGGHFLNLAANNDSSRNTGICHPLKRSGPSLADGSFFFSHEKNDDNKKSCFFPSCIIDESICFEMIEMSHSLNLNQRCNI